jgi:hypothetical protein
MIVSDNASAVKNVKSLEAYIVRFENKIVSSALKNALACYYAGVVVVNLAVVGLDPGYDVLYLNIKIAWLPVAGCRNSISSAYTN